jgi:hypothetical protein
MPPEAGVLESVSSVSAMVIFYVVGRWSRVVWRRVGRGGRARAAGNTFNSTENDRDPR